MTKDQKTTVTEYATSLLDEDLRFINVRLAEKMQGDLPEVLNFLAYDRPIDEILATAGSAKELFGMSEQIREVVGRECKRRGISSRYA